VAAQNIKLRVPKAVSPPLPPPPQSDVFKTFAEQLAELRNAAENLDLKRRLTLELDGRGKSPAPEVVTRLNELLAKVSKALSLK